MVLLVVEDSADEVSSLSALEATDDQMRVRESDAHRRLYGDA